MRTILLVLVCVACSRGQQPPPATAATAAASPASSPADASASPATPGPAEQARSLYTSVCAICHGPNGQGDGPAAASLDPKPRDYSDPKWQASMTDDQIKRIIVAGGAGVGESAMMPAQPQLENQPQVLDELVKIIRGFGRK